MYDTCIGRIMNIHFESKTIQNSKVDNSDFAHEESRGFEKKKLIHISNLTNSF